MSLLQASSLWPASPRLTPSAEHVCAGCSAVTPLPHPPSLRNHPRWSVAAAMSPSGSSISLASKAMAVSTPGGGVDPRVLVAEQLLCMALTGCRLLRLCRAALPTSYSTQKLATSSHLSSFYSLNHIQQLHTVCVQFERILSEKDGVKKTGEPRSSGKNRFCQLTPCQLLQHRQ